MSLERNKKNEIFNCNFDGTNTFYSKFVRWYISVVSCWRNKWVRNCNVINNKGTKEMKHFDIELFIKDLDKLFNNMQDKAIAGSENVATASWVIKNQANEIEYWKQMFEKAMKTQESDKHWEKHL